MGTSVAKDSFGDIRKGVSYIGRVGEGSDSESVTIKVFGEILVREVSLDCTPPVYWTPVKILRISEPYTNVRVAASFDAGLILATVVNEEGTVVKVLDLKGNLIWSKPVPLKRGDEVMDVIPVGTGGHVCCGDN